MVTIQAHDNDKYGRTIGEVTLEDGRNLSQELVKAGYAWWFFKYSDDEHLRMVEVQAKIAKVGLWVDTNPVPHKTCFRSVFLSWAAEFSFISTAGFEFFDHMGMRTSPRTIFRPR
jgi:hypothetical protein